MKEFSIYLWPIWVSILYSNYMTINRVVLLKKFQISKSDLFFVQIITFELNIGYSKFKWLLKPILVERPLVRMISFDFKIGKEYDGSITSNEHNNMKNAVKIQETNAQPKFIGFSFYSILHNKFWIFLQICKSNS